MSEIFTGVILNSSAATAWSEEETARQLVLSTQSISRWKGHRHLAVIFDSPTVVLTGVEAAIDEIGDIRRRRRTHVSLVLAEGFQEEHDWWPDEETWILDLGYSHDTYGCDGLDRELSRFRFDEGGTADLKSDEAIQMLSQARYEGQGFHAQRIKRTQNPMAFPGHGESLCSYCYTMSNAAYVLRHWAGRSAMFGGVKVLMASPWRRKFYVWTMFDDLATLFRQNGQGWPLDVVERALAGRQIALATALTVRQALHGLSNKVLSMPPPQGTHQERWVEKLRRGELLDGLRRLLVLLEDAAFWHEYEPAKEESHGLPEIFRHSIFPSDGKVEGQFAILRRDEQEWREELRPFGVQLIDWQELQQMIEGTYTDEDFLRSAIEAILSLESSSQPTGRAAVARELGLSEEAFKKRMSRNGVSMKILQERAAEVRDGDIVKL